MNKLATATLLTLILAVGVAQADEAKQPPWSGSLGLSWLSTSGNTDTSSFGLDFALKRTPDPWGLDVGANLVRADQNGQLTAERYNAHGRAERAIGERWTAFAGLSGERDRFAGFDLRGVVESGASYKILTGPQHQLSVDGGLTWTRLDITDDGREEWLGGLLGLSYAWKITETSSVTERLVWYPNFKDSGQWRVTSEAAVQAALSSVLALKLGYLLRYDHQPVPGFHTTDTATTASLVLQF
jgi:putative salt-induced outer membrane protein